MDFDENLFLNFVPIIAVTAITTVTFFTFFHKLRYRWPVNLQCWFCSNYTKVSRSTLDWWFCSHCEQYNGFSVDGDYNYDIPEQYKSTNRKNKNNSFCERKKFLKRHSSLCYDCNRKEELKLFKLRKLENSVDGFCSSKLRRFERKLEKNHPLCSKCQNVVQNVLYKQTLWLAQYKMLLFKQRPIKKIIENQERIEIILRVFLTILAITTIYFTDIWYLPLCGIFLQLLVCLITTVEKRQSKIFIILGWACLLLVRNFSILTSLKMLNIHIDYAPPINSDNSYYFIFTLGTLISLANLTFQTSKSISNKALTFKKLDSPNTIISEPYSYTPPPDSACTDSEFSFNGNLSRSFHSPVNITDSLLTPSAFETPIPLKPTTLNQLSAVSMSDQSSRSNNKNKVDTPCRATTCETDLLKLPNNQQANDNLSVLNSLSLGSNKKLSPSQSSGIFETKVYGTTSPDIFSKHTYSSKRSILAPPKLRSTAQSAYSAGGYWQAGLDTPTLSRSSSQSSGLGSLASREPSVNEFDRCSIASERECFATTESSIALQNAARRSRDDCSRRCSQSSGIGDSKTLQYHIRNDTQCSGHTTIVTNPVWVPVLVCGSLLFNMAILCAILMR